MEFRCVCVVAVTLLITTSVEEEGFVNCPGLQECLCNEAMTSVYCIDKNLSIIPDIPRTTRRLHLEENRLMKLQTRCPNLENIFLTRNVITTVEPFTFADLGNLTYLTIAGNQLVILGDYSFANIPKLKELNLFNNGIRSISTTAFVGSSAIKSIQLNSNKLSTVPYLGHQQQLGELNLQRNLIVNVTFPALFTTGSQQIGIDLSMNSIKALTNKTFISLVNANLSRLYLSDNKISDVDPGAFSGITSVSTLRFKGNPLTKVSIKNIALGLAEKSLTSLDLSGVFHIGFNVKDMISPLGLLFLETLRLTSNSISLLTDNMFLQFRHLTVLDLSKNMIYKCAKKVFKGLEKLMILNLADNIMSSIPENLPRALKVLDLSRNLITSINNELERSCSLQVLNLQQNKLKLFRKDAFRGLRSLNKLIVASNYIHFLPGMFEPLQNLTHLDLSGNRLRSINLPKIHFRPLSSLKFLNLADNQCAILKENMFTHLTSLVSLHLERNNLSSVVSQYGGQLFAGLNCLEELYITSNNITTLPEDFLKNQTSLKTLKADHNKIGSWSPKLFKFTKKLERLNLKDNKISFIGKESLEYLNSLKYMNLNDNPFTCNCDLLWFRDWMDHTNVDMAEKMNYRCSGPKQWHGQKLLDFDKTKLTCPIVKYNVAQSMGAAAAGIVFTSCLGILIYRFRWRIRLRAYLFSKRGKMFLRHIRTTKQQRNYGAIGDGEMQFDAYISCSEHDNPWVLHHLLPGIDNGQLNDDTPFEGEFRLYYDERDSEAGASIVANIFEHMSRSRTMLIVLTRHYYNGMNEFELDQATAMLYDHELDDIIVIKVGDVAARRVPPHLYAKMRSGSFIEWDENEDAIYIFRGKLKDRLRGSAISLNLL